MVRMVGFCIHQQGAGVETILYIWHREMYHQLYVCVLFGARALLIKTPSLCSNKLHLLPFLRNARSMHYAAYK